MVECGGDIKGGKFLLSKGVDINAVDDLGETALHYAVRSGCIEMVQFLAKNMDKVDVVDRLGRTALYRAAELGHLKIVQYLAEMSDVNTRNAQNMTALHCAAKCGSFGIARHLITNGADVRARDGQEEQFCTTSFYHHSKWVLELFSILSTKELAWMM